MKLIDLTGQKFGEWTVLGRSKKSTAAQSRWQCRCSCGKKAEVLRSNLRSGSSLSCGCAHREDHGQSRTTTYNVWKSMIQRCYYPKHIGFKYYGGKGIKVCKRWRRSFNSFLADMGERPKGMSIDRINTAKGYSKRNCRWATPKTNCRNRTNNVTVSFKGATKTIAEWCEEFHLNPNTVYARKYRGLSDELVLSTKPLRRAR